MFQYGGAEKHRFKSKAHDGKAVNAFPWACLFFIVFDKFQPLQKLLSLALGLL